MKKLWNGLKSIAPHINLICAAMLLTFLIIEVINPYAGFVNHRYTRIILVIWIAAALFSSILLIAAQRREFLTRQAEEDSAGEPEAVPAPKQPRQSKSRKKPQAKHLK